MKNLGKIVLLALGGAVLGFGCGTLAVRYAPRLFHFAHWAGWQKGVLLASLPLAWLVAVLCHELGHVALGRTQHFEFKWLVVGPFMWKKQAGRLRFEWNKNLNSAGGLALCVPPDDDNLRRRFMAFALGGPLGSLAWAVGALGGYALLPAVASAGGQVAAAGLAASGAISALLALITLVPMHVGGFYSDGGRVFNLRRGGPAGQLDLAVLSAVVRSMAGVRPQALPLTLLEAAAALPQELPFKLYAFHYLYLAALDAGDVAQAGFYLAEYRQRTGFVPEALQASVWLEAAFFAAAYEGDLPAARQFQAQARLTSHIPADVPARVEAALARLAQHPALARTHAQTALRELPKNIDQGSAQFYTEWLTATVHWATSVESAEAVSAA